MNFLRLSTKEKRSRCCKSLASGQKIKSQAALPFTPLWNGEDEVDGTYFYQITLRAIDDASLIVKSEGFVQLVK